MLSCYFSKFLLFCRLFLLSCHIVSINLYQYVRHLLSQRNTTVRILLQLLPSYAFILPYHLQAVILLRKLVFIHANQNKVFLLKTDGNTCSINTVSLPMSQGYINSLKPYFFFVCKGPTITTSLRVCHILQ